MKAYLLQALLFQRLFEGAADVRNADFALNKPCEGTSNFFVQIFLRRYLLSS